MNHPLRLDVTTTLSQSLLPNFNLPPPLFLASRDPSTLPSSLLCPPHPSSRGAMPDSPPRPRHVESPMPSPVLPRRHGYTRRRGACPRSKRNKVCHSISIDLFSTKEKKTVLQGAFSMPLGHGSGSVSRLAAPVRPPAALDPPDGRSIREMRPGSPLLRLSFGAGSSPTCQRLAAGGHPTARVQAPGHGAAAAVRAAGRRRSRCRRNLQGPHRHG